jgi:hypothetical protein
MAGITGPAAQQYKKLAKFWLNLEFPRYDAAEKLQDAYEAVIATIDRNPGLGEPFLRPFRSDERINKLGFR